MAVIIILMIIVLRQGSSLLSYFILTALYSQKYFDVHLLLKSYLYFLSIMNPISTHAPYLSDLN